MVTGLLKRIFGSRNERLLRQYSATVRIINTHEPEISKLTDTELQAKTAEFKQRFAAGESLDDMLPEAFAVVREAGKRVVQCDIDPSRIGLLSRVDAGVVGDAGR